MSSRSCPTCRAFTITRRLIEHEGMGAFPCPDSWHDTDHNREDHHAMTTTEPLKKHERVTGTDRDVLARELAKKYTKGASIRALAEEYGRSYGFVHRILSEHEVTLRSRGYKGPKA